jgi:hypothetical protein
MTKFAIPTSCMLGALLLISGCSSKSAHQPPAEQTDQAAQKKSFKPPTPEEMQAAFKKAATPTQEHELLKKLSGNWKAKAKWWMDPTKEPETSKASSKNSMIFGGKFLKEEYKGKFMGKPFDGLSYLGYDTVAEQFTSVWIDSMSTMTMTSTGSYDEATKTITLHGEMSCPMYDGKVKTRSLIRIVDDKHHEFEMFNTGPDGQEQKSLEIAYSK